MGFVLAVVALVLFVLSGLEVSLGDFGPGQLLAFGLAFLTGALMVGIGVPGFIGRRV